MTRISIAVASLLTLAGGAQALPTDVVYKGGGTFTVTSGCTGFNPINQFFLGTYFVPVAGSTNGPDSTITFHFGNGGAEGFKLTNDVFTSTFKAVTATHVYTRTGSYPAFVSISPQVPAVITTTTPRVTVIGFVKGWDNVPNCLVHFQLNMVKDLMP